MVSKSKNQASQSWWTTVPGLFTALGGLIAAVAGLVTALKAAGLIGTPIALPASSPAPQTIVVNSPQVPDPNSDPQIDATMLGATGWIYVGTRVKDQWRTTAAEGIEPARTLRVDGLPVRGMTYSVERGMNIRDSLPTATVPGERPAMPRSRGTIDSTYKVKIDDVREILLTNPTRVWVWAHVTVAAKD